MERLVLYFSRAARAGRAFMYAAVTFVYRQAASEQYVLVASQWVRGQNGEEKGGQAHGPPPHCPARGRCWFRREITAGLSRVRGQR